MTDLFAGAGGSSTGTTEVAASMAPPTEYLRGTRSERVRMAGNAVTPPAARDLVAAVAEVLA